MKLFLLALALLAPAHPRHHPLVRHPRRGPSKPALWTAYCFDGTHTFATNRHGACSHHGGVKQWITH